MRGSTTDPSRSTSSSCQNESRGYWTIWMCRVTRTSDEHGHARLRKLNDGTRKNVNSCTASMHNDDPGCRGVTLELGIWKGLPLISFTWPSWAHDDRSTPIEYVFPVPIYKNPALSFEVPRELSLTSAPWCPWEHGPSSDIDDSEFFR
jgi:hypothetical protein